LFVDFETHPQIEMGEAETQLLQLTLQNAQQVCCIAFYTDRCRSLYRSSNTHFQDVLDAQEAERERQRQLLKQQQEAIRLQVHSIAQFHAAILRFMLLQKEADARAASAAEERMQEQLQQAAQRNQNHQETMKREQMIVCPFCGNSL
jgi:hypothetical protein